MPFVPKRHFEIHQQKQKELAALSPRPNQVIAAQSGHCPQMSESEVVIDAIKAVASQLTARP